MPNSFGEKLKNGLDSIENCPKIDGLTSMQLCCLLSLSAIMSLPTSATVPSFPLETILYLKLA